MGGASFREASEESPITNESPEQGVSENTLSQEMSAEEIFDLAANLVAESEREHAREAQGQFQEQVIAQRNMIREELMRAENGERQEDGRNLTESGEFSDKLHRPTRGASEWMMEKLDGIPGGKKFLGGLALIAGLSALPEEGYANDSRYTIQNRHAEKKGIFDGVFESMGRTANQEIKRTGQDIVRSPRKVFDESIRKLEQQDRERGMAMKQIQRQQEQDARNQERDAERYVDTVSREIVNFKRNFDRTSLQSYRSLEDRNTNILRAALDSLSKFEALDNEYLKKYQGEAYGLSRIARGELSSFVRKMEGGKFSQAKHIPNPLREVSLEKFLASQSSPERQGNRVSQEDAPRYIPVDDSEDGRAISDSPRNKPARASQYGNERFDAEYVDVRPSGTSKKSEGQRPGVNGQSEWDRASSTNMKPEPRKDSGPVSPLYRF